MVAKKPTLPTAEAVRNISAAEAAALVVTAAQLEALGSPAKIEFTWDDLPDASVQEYTRAPSAVDVVALTPEPIRLRVEASHEAWKTSMLSFANRMAESGKTATEPQLKAALLQANKDAMRVQLAGTPERAAAFLKLAKRYASYVGYTMRGDVDKSDPTRVVYYVKKKETRAKKSA